MKKRIAVVCLLLLMLFAASAVASTPVHGRTRIYGYKDEIHKPANRFAPYAVYTREAHVEDRYLEFYYNKLNTYERSWSIAIVDGDGNVKYDGPFVKVYLPFPSIWSEEQGEYWKWTKTYAQKHYTWKWATGYYTEFTDSYVEYVRGDYRRFEELGDFGPCVYFSEMPFSNGITYFVKFE